MTLAADARLAVPATRLQAIGTRRILLVRRFDVTEQGGRLHMVSLKTLCRERPGVFVTGYDDVAEAVRKHSADPLADVAALFRQAAFNAAIGNVDDHLKNFWMLHGDNGWRLSPAFDLVPDTGAKRDHTLTFGLGLGCPTRDVLAGMGERWGVRESVDVVDEVTGAVRGFAQAAKRLRVKGATSVRQIQADIDRRLGLLQG